MFNISFLENLRPLINQYFNSLMFLIYIYIHIFSGVSERNLAGLDPAPVKDSKVDKLGIVKHRQNTGLAMLARKLFDEKIPLRKKVRMLGVLIFSNYFCNFQTLQASLTLFLSPDFIDNREFHL